MNNALKTPILFVIFNRPDKTKIVFNEIRKAKPKKLYISCDGPRDDVLDDIKHVEETRHVVMSNIDWDCEVQTCFRKKNVGLISGYCGAISWFFEHEEEGIILEDDTLPDSSFFQYCGEMLERYRDDLRVMNICGFNIDTSHRYDSSYFFSYFPHAWGWATWRRAWNLYELDLDKYLKIDPRSFSPTHSYQFFYESFKKVYEGKLNSCLLRWYFAISTNNGLSVIPSKSLIKNIGFDASGTNFKTDASPYSKINRTEMKFPLKHPITINSNFYFDSLRIGEASENNTVNEKLIFSNVKLICRKIIRKLTKIVFPKNRDK
jgi:hypothetical protein